MLDPFDLHRFVEAQDVFYTTARRELTHGRKRSHWMWFIFPQLGGLGTSVMAVRYAISGLEEARAYLRHPVLGPRLCECTMDTLGIPGKSLRSIFGTPDDLKFRSSMTLFAIASDGAAPFSDAIAGPCGGHVDRTTIALLQGRS